MMMMKWNLGAKPLLVLSRDCWKKYSCNWQHCARWECVILLTGLTSIICCCFCIWYWYRWASIIWSCAVTGITIWPCGAFKHKTISKYQLHKAFHTGRNMQSVYVCVYVCKRERERERERETEMKPLETWSRYSRATLWSGSRVWSTGSVGSIQRE